MVDFKSTNTKIRIANPDQQQLLAEILNKKQIIPLSDYLKPKTITTASRDLQSRLL